MQIADFDTASMHHHRLFRDAKIAMLTHRVLSHMQATATSVNEVEEALEEFADAARHERPAADFALLEAGETLGL
ncbi:hypothetical protein [Mesorhizobium sp.]|uniref:hypothetical protein n=1 Tax=Mesorhizobium sp. TaxID=1871066 RepID=UPI000FE6B82F|nr:hypothetical protein [Mesorhizobium sp.]RWD66656.1 MAG: hypothetical protein EOS37_24065 [Mesorhizobium sp.]TIV61933.1 MAG: hypothetical protein E5V80_02310 [Mesorhizobium sp.]